MKPFFTEYFKKQLRSLKKKYPRVKEDFLRVIDKINLKEEISIGRSIYKIRIGSSDMKKGKSGGFRSYIYLYIKKDLLVPLCIYAKSEKEIVSEGELQYHFDKTIEELVRVI